MSDTFDCPTCGKPSLFSLSESEDGKINWCPDTPHFICDLCGMTWVQVSDADGPYLTKVTSQTYRQTGRIPTSKIMYATIAFVVNKVQQRHEGRSI